ncbi:MAG: Flp family type IVb pilin [Planctomycetes bacterium]|nr:Flp family type IVb pilin [Planctomycetota bacterium]
MQQLIKWFRSKTGQTLVEYALILVLVAVVCVAVVSRFGQQTENIMPKIGNAMEEAESAR